MELLKVFLFSMLANVATCQSYNDSGVDISDVISGSKVLSRRKRFIVFPEGSSLQLVFCVTYPMIFTIGDIFLWGYTSALAYELPQDPYSPFMHHADPLHRRMDSKMIYFTDSRGKVLWGKEYKRKPIVNPAMAKRSVRKKEKFEIDRKLMHASQHKRGFLKNERMDGRSAEFHRSGRASLYPKIEMVLQAMGSNGRDCVLRTLCLVGQTQHHPQGSFLQEITRAVFTLPKGNDMDDMQEYDEAYSATKSCAALYPDCDEPAQDQLSPLHSAIIS